ncbi:hypothetical protein Tsubulata_044461 [Turnera subulata]|uniref:DUF4283 domain-containing protein n=1 Tax=Turnera subulata TaxID=218843 RepID=A0A9Q0JBC0_9ROSI|nr:hypothetical protein Tsubulata_044461 [Turnera subulata]
MAASSSRWVIDLGGDNTESNEITPEESLGAVVARTYVVGKILGDRRPHISQIRSQMSSVWYIKGDFRIIPKPNKVFLIGFELEEDKKKVLKGTPWLVSNMHFCLKGWYPDLILSQVSFRQVLFWVQIHDIPTALLSHEKIAKIGSVFPVFHHYEPSLEAMLGWQGFVRARVEIVSDMPLLPGVACLDQSGKEIWIRFQYERLGELCHRCGRITHPTIRCIKPHRQGEEGDRPAEENFGPWMRAKEVFGKHYPAKKQVSMDTPDVLTESDEAQATGGDPNINAISPCSNNIITRSVSKKHKAVEEVLMSPINENARRAHTGMMNTIAELVTDLHDASPIHSSASKPSWKRMARTTKVKYQPSTLDLIQAFDMEAEGRVSGNEDRPHHDIDNGVTDVPHSKE